MDAGRDALEAGRLFAHPLTKKREETRRLVHEIEAKVSGYILGQGLLCLIVGALAFAAYLLVLQNLSQRLSRLLAETRTVIADH